ncbi:MAG: aminotransferase class III-fold pyridoxal phosphate-dependent enzyme, partial [Crocosphaera sp.]
GLINGLEINEEMSITSIDIVKAAMEEGLLLAPAGPKVLRFVPPLIVTEEEINQAAEMLEKAINTVCATMVN